MDEPGHAGGVAYAGGQPALRSDVLISPALWRGAVRVHMLKDPCNGRAFRVGVKEHFIIARLDGKRSLAEIERAYAREFGFALSQAHWRRMLGLLHRRGLLVGSPPGRPGSGTVRPAGRRGAHRRNTLLRGDVRLVADPAACVDRLRRLTGFARTPLFLVLALVLVTAMEIGMALRGSELGREGLRAVLHLPSLAAVAVLLWVSLALHELAHGVVAGWFGGSVSEIGLRWRLPMIIMYCRVENYMYLPRRRHQVATAAAGAAANLLFLLPFYPLWALLPPCHPVRDVTAALLLAGTGQALLNLVPLPPLDGYQILSHVLGMADYAAESRKYLLLLTRRQQASRSMVSGYPRPVRLAYLGYAIGSALLVLGACTGGVLLCRHFLTDRFGAAATVVPTVLLALMVAATVARPRGRTVEPG
jgi:putative peptide zinc metalloprotease protein